MVIHDEGLILGQTLTISYQGVDLIGQILSQICQDQKTKHLKRELSGPLG